MTEKQSAYGVAAPPTVLARERLSHQSADGEKHIADVKTESGVVLEFLHSHLRRDERESRERFYQKMVWVVDGVRRKRDTAQFFALVDKANIVNRKPLIVSAPSNEGALLRDWVGSHAAVFFDFGDDSEPPDLPSFGGPVLWQLDPHSPNGRAHLSPVLKTLFLDTCLKGLPLAPLPPVPPDLRPQWVIDFWAGKKRKRPGF
jgi:hypothetical protein